MFYNVVLELKKKLFI